MPDLGVEGWTVIVLASLKVLDVIVKATPTDKDDFVVDVILRAIRKPMK